jgi:hypothetical protein
MALDPKAKAKIQANHAEGNMPAMATLSPLRRLSHPPERRSGIKSNRLSKIQELQDAYAVLASLDSTYERLTAPDPVAHRLLA